MTAPKELHPLTFAELRRANVVRCEGPTFSHGVSDWSATDWATAAAGELGEACNFIKKLRRGEPIERAAIAAELADAVTYIDLLAERLGIDLGQAVAWKFNHVSQRRGAQERLHTSADNGRPCDPGVPRA